MFLYNGQVWHQIHNGNFIPYHVISSLRTDTIHLIDIASNKNFKRLTQMMHEFCNTISIVKLGIQLHTTKGRKRYEKDSCFDFDGIVFGKL